MDILLTDDIIIDYRVDSSDFGIDNAGLEFDVGFENLLGPPVVVVPTSNAGGPHSTVVPSSSSLLVKGEVGGIVTVATVEQSSLPDSPPDSSGSPPSSVYSPVDPRDTRKRRRNSDGTGTVLCDLMLSGGGGGIALKDEGKDQLQGYNNGMVMNNVTQCPAYSTNNSDDIKPLMVVSTSGDAYHQQQDHQQQQQQANNNYHQLTVTPAGYYSAYLDFDGGASAYSTTATVVAEDLYNNQQQQQHHHQQAQHHHTFVDMPAESHNLNTSGTSSSNNSNNNMGDLMVSPDPLQRKRKLPMDRSFDDASPGTSATPDSQYASDRGMGTMAQGTSSSSNAGDGGSIAGDGSLPGTPMQCIRFEPFQAQQWHPLCDHQLQDLPTPHYRVDADKGFNFSASDDAFVCQKKNHFQVTCHTQLIAGGGGGGVGATAVGTGTAASPNGTTATAAAAAFNVIFVRTQNGLEKVRNFCLHFYGVKFEAPRHMIRVEQSQSDRSKKVFHPVVIDLHCGQVSKTTVGRLHFSETTSNNMRKKGRPNPEQRYFRLVVALHAHTHTGDYPVVVHGSEKIIVRASNPGQFENDFELCWQRGVTPDSIFHNGRIGLNTDQPDECLVVNGNLKVTGHILQPSDCRIKRELKELDTRQQLENIQQIRIVKYAYQEGCGGGGGGVGGQEAIATTGVMAQEVRRVLPDAVFEQQAAYQMPGGGKLDKFLVVNKDRIFLENVGAVKELSKVTGKLEQRIQQLEMSQGELAAMARNSRDLSISPKKTLKDVDRSRQSWDTVKLGNHSIQWIIVILIIVMTVCLSTLATLFFMEHYDSMRHRYYDSIAFRRPDVDDVKSASVASALGSSKHQSIAYSHNYSVANAEQAMYGGSRGNGKPGKKGTSYKTEGGNYNNMPFPPFSDTNRSGTAADGMMNGMGGADPANLQNLNWNNIEFSFLYIYKLQQYYNELQKKVKDKLPLVFGKETAAGEQKQQQGALASGTTTNGGVGGAGTGDVMVDNPSNPAGDEDCDSAEGEETNGGPEAVSNNGDLKLDEEFMNRFLANILSIRNQSSSTTTEMTLAEEAPKMEFSSDKSAIEEEAAAIKEKPVETSSVTPPPVASAVAAAGKKERLKAQQEQQQQPDIENLINSNK